MKCQVCGNDYPSEYYFAKPNICNECHKKSTSQNTSVTDQVAAIPSTGSRKYGTAYSIAKFVEVVSWLILIGGVIAGIALGAQTKEVTLGVTISVTSLIFGLLLVLAAQLTLVFIETENNTRQAVNELARTNSLLATLVQKNNK